MRYLGIANLRDIERMTISEYELRLKAYRLKRLDEQEFIYQQAWANWQVQSTKQQGKKQVPVYSTFKKFFDKEKFEKQKIYISSNPVTP